MARVQSETYSALITRTDIFSVSETTRDPAFRFKKRANFIHDRPGVEAPADARLRIGQPNYEGHTPGVLQHQVPDGR